MTKFSASDAALEGFRLTRERPATIVAWMGIYCAVMLLMGGIMLGLLGKDLIELLKSGQQISPEDMAEALVHSWPAIIIVLLLGVALISVLTAGIYRIILRPQEQGFPHLRLGLDELRIGAVNLILFSVGFVCLFVSLMVATLAKMAAGDAVEHLVVAISVVTTAWIGVRLSMATPMTFVMRRITIKDAWRLSRGAFFPLLGMNVLAVIFYVIVYLLVTVICVALLTVSGTQAGGSLAQAGPLAMVALLIVSVFQLLLPVLQVVMIYAPFAVAYEQLHGDTSVDPLRRTPPALQS